MVDDIEDQGAATIIAGVMHAAEQRGLSVAVRASLDSAERESMILRDLRGERHRAVIIATSRTTHPNREAVMHRALATLAQDGAAVAVIGDNAFSFPTVTVDNRLAARALAEHLVADGARRFAVLAGPEFHVTSDDRTAGFLDGLHHAGVDVADVPVVREKFSRDGGYAGFATIEHHTRELDVVATMSDAMAVGAIVRSRERGLELHEDIEITGFDHVPVIGDLLPAFTTVEIPLEAMGATAVSLVTDPHGETQQRIVLHGRTLLRGRPTE
ncbi:LacI family DNA-binding transcriptional regulator [Curtobacterium flaccumfaciens]|uniref:LacI family DNA-binding transcriptional regulator n=1 Tax=Curtobacterium flaccumfaciens TaxID=2035 RepID=UPI001E5E2B62|nr:substrate-binding domain-containing protein [Curtobacterium allii]MCE0459465.1 substrate-binding domain-containing protein [Curtobacterium allii]